MIYQNSKVLAASSKVYNAILAFKGNENYLDRSFSEDYMTNKVFRNVSNYRLIPNSYLQKFHKQYDLKKHRKAVLKLGVIIDQSKMVRGNKIASCGNSNISYFGLVKKYKKINRGIFFKDRCKYLHFKERAILQVKITEITKSSSDVSLIRGVSVIYKNMRTK